MPGQNIYILTADGDRELFDPGKLEHSLELAGASSTERARVLAHVMHELRPDMKSEDIYRHAFQILSREAVIPVAARYSIKRAVFALGPSGFPFEQFLAEILRGHRYKAITGVTLTGRCAIHEVDVLAERDDVKIGIEAKFHNDPGGKTDIKDVLYVKARYDDLKDSSFPDSRVGEGWMVTNTRFTHNAIHYAQCAGLTLIGWDYPRERGLLTLIEEARVHPLTALTTLSESEKRQFLDKKIVLCKSITSPHVLREFGIRPDKIDRVLQEARELCG
ncbi:restriction endonuclease [Candidatus Kaiserbacteria bacterium]|nr:restriction endonuclease [Candidatus Kaiserbacteria bacterium]